MTTTKGSTKYHSKSSISSVIGHHSQKNPLSSAFHAKFSFETFGISTIFSYCVFFFIFTKLQLISMLMISLEKCCLHILKYGSGDTRLCAKVHLVVISNLLLSH